MDDVDEGDEAARNRWMETVDESKTETVAKVE